jgi:hypothetical protein
MSPEAKAALVRQNPPRCGPTCRGRACLEKGCTDRREAEARVIDLVLYDARRLADAADSGLYAAMRAIGRMRTSAPVHVPSYGQRPGGAARGARAVAG